MGEKIKNYASILTRSNNVTSYITEYQYEMDFRKHFRLRDGSIKWCELGNGSID